MSTTAPAERPPSLWEDLLEIFYAPTAVFERRRETPAFGLALLVFVILALGLFLVFKNVNEPVMDAEMKRSMAQMMKQNPKVTPEMAASFTETGKKFAVLGVLGFSCLIPLLLGLCLWVVGKVLESKAELGQLMMVATYSYYPRVLESILNAVQLLIVPEDSIHSRFSVSLGVGRILNQDQVNPYLFALVSRIDVFTIWVTVLLGIGLHVMGRVPRDRAILGAVLMWLIGAILPLVGAMQISN